MMYLFVIFCSAVILGAGFILSRKHFFQVAELTLSLLNSLLDSSADDSEKQRLITRSLGRLILSLARFIAAIIVLLSCTLLPILFFIDFDFTQLGSLDFNSLEFFLVLAAGSMIPFVVFSFRKQKGDYSELSVLLHRIALNNYNIARSLFSIEMSLNKAKTR
ncbi:MAG TPA: hypothetical protein VK625_12765, partial [Flavitalea sp.]|nr:hypothetical protein [Flavitalea sp.]